MEREQAAECGDEGLDAVPWLQASEETDHEIAVGRSVVRAHVAVEELPPHTARDHPHATGRASPVPDVGGQDVRRDDHPIGPAEQDSLEGVGGCRIREAAVRLLLGGEWRVHLEKERDAVAASEAETGVGPERIALVDELDRPPGMQPLEVLAQALVQEQPVHLGGLGGRGPTSTVDSGRQAVECGEEVVGVDVDRLAVDPATFRESRGEQLHLRGPRDERIHELPDVGRRAVRSGGGDTAVGRDVGDAHSIPAPRCRGGAARAA